MRLGLKLAIISTAALAAGAVAAGAVTYQLRRPSCCGARPRPAPSLVPQISVSLPEAHAEVGSPLVVQGRAFGSWYFEASFPVKVVDANGVVVAQGPAQALSDWMVNAPVPFRAVLQFAATPTSHDGAIVLSRDNPSGLPSNDASISWPIVFASYP